MKLFNNSRGDTIVEVMIAMAVASMVLGSAYTITNRSLANSLQAQEHAEALKLAQSQVEQIRSFANKRSSTDPLFQTSNTSCVAVTAGTVPAGQVRVFPTNPALPAAESVYPAECRNIGTVNYRTGFKYNSATRTFTVYVNWDGPRGGQDQVSLVYKAYPGV